MASISAVYARKFRKYKKLWVISFKFEGNKANSVGHFWSIHNDHLWKRKTLVNPREEIIVISGVKLLWKIEFDTNVS